MDQYQFLHAQPHVLTKMKMFIFQKSTGCTVYAMFQHYLWLVVFVWMTVEGLQMYLSLVQVFGSHISKYMIKFNLAAWGKTILLYNVLFDDLSVKLSRSRNPPVSPILHYH